LLGTGLRKSEALGVEIADCAFSETSPVSHLRPEIEKNRKGGDQPVPPDLASDLAAWLEVRKEAHRLKNPGNGQGKKFGSEKLFTLTPGLNAIFNKDLQAAGISKQDERGRYADIHALRYTYGTNLARMGVHPKMAQILMRHATIELTMSLYTDPQLFDKMEAVSRHPAFPSPQIKPENLPISTSGLEAV